MNTGVKQEKSCPTQTKMVGIIQIIFSINMVGSKKSISHFQ